MIFSLSLSLLGLQKGVLQFWNTTDQTWHPIPDPKSPRPAARNWGQTATTWDSYLYLYGGMDDVNSTILGDLWRFGPVTDRNSLLSAE